MGAVRRLVLHVPDPVVFGAEASGRREQAAACLPVVAAAFAVGLGKLHDEIRHPLPSVARQLRCSTIGWDCPQVPHHIEVCGSIAQIPSRREIWAGIDAVTG